MKDVVNDDSLHHVGEIRFTMYKLSTADAESQCINIGTDGAVNGVKLEIKGDGYFTDSTLAQNYGKTKILSGYEKVYYSNGDFEMSLLGKEHVMALNSGAHNPNWSFNIAELAGTKLQGSLYWGGSNVHGDIGVLAGFNITAFYAANCAGLYGDIKALMKSGMTNVQIDNTKISGDLGVCGTSGYSWANLTFLTMNNTKVSGDISGLRGCTKMGTNLQMKGLSLSGNIGALPDNILFVSNEGGSSNFTWGTGRSKCLAMDQCRFADVDGMLNAQAGLAAEFGGSQSWFKTISVKGTRTSASDSAVATLTSKGYSVVVTP